VYKASVTDTVRQDATRAPVRQLVVEVIEGPDAGTRTTGDEVIVGSAAGSGLRLSDPAVSRYHLELRTSRGGISVRDHGSTNGTFIGTIRVEHAVVQPDTIVRIGDTALRLAEAAPGQVELHASEALGNMVGRSPAMRRVMVQIERAAQSEVSVLVNGESGTGKELVARALHDLGPRRAKPFVTVDCGALPPTLIASELFGHERGAFTGADRMHVGAFEAASGGTLFLDEIGELQPAVQATLLGVLERRRIRRLGGRQELAVDVRVVAATHRDLRTEVNAGTFRLDLFYRLAVVTLKLPPLRERPDDIPLLVEHFLREAGWEQPIASLISPSAMDALSRLHLAGNVRELRNIVEGAVAMGEVAPVLDAREVPVPVDASGFTTDLSLPYKEARAQLVDQFEARYVEALLARTRGNVSAAARLGRMTRSHLTELLAKRRA
jgi:DNA-binding NtrC family response regulator